MAGAQHSRRQPGWWLLGTLTFALRYVTRERSRTLARVSFARFTQTVLRKCTRRRRRRRRHVGKLLGE